MKKQPIHTKNIFSNRAPPNTIETSWEKYVTALLVLWLIIILSSFLLSIFIEINQKYYMNFILINFLVMIIIAIQTVSFFVKKINNIQEQFVELSKYSNQPKPVQYPPILEQKVKYNASNKKYLDEIFSKLTELNSRVVDLESKVYPHLPLNKKMNIKTEESLTRGSSDPILVQDLIDALNFPKDETDTEGFRKLRIGLSDTENGDLLRASQDVQTLLSQDGIYMDDLAHEQSKPEIWRRYSKGERGIVISSLGIIDDHELISKIVERLKNNEIFRDSSYHFLRHFDSSLQNFCKKANDEEISRFSNTRTARAFKLLGTATDRFS